MTARPWDSEPTPRTDKAYQDNKHQEMGDLVDDLTALARSLEPRLRAAERLLEKFVSNLGPCDHYDHHGYCQSHFGEMPCSVGGATAHLAAAREEDGE